MKTVKDLLFGLNIIEVNGNFDCNDAKDLESLEGSPEVINGHFDCSDCYIHSLEGGPIIVKGNFNCYANSRLTSLDGCPLEVGGDFHCWDTKMDGPFRLEEVESRCNVKGAIYLRHGRDAKTNT